MDSATSGCHRLRPADPTIGGSAPCSGHEPLTVPGEVGPGVVERLDSIRKCPKASKDGGGSDY
jgi:hypothetical protein